MDTPKMNREDFEKTKSELLDSIKDEKGVYADTVRDLAEGMTYEDYEKGYDEFKEASERFSAILQKDEAIAKKKMAYNRIAQKLSIPLVFGGILFSQVSTTLCVLTAAVILLGLSQAATIMLSSIVSKTNAVPALSTIVQVSIWLFGAVYVGSPLFITLTAALSAVTLIMLIRGLRSS